MKNVKREGMIKIADVPEREPKTKKEFLNNTLLQLFALIVIECICNYITQGQTTIIHFIIAYGVIKGLHYYCGLFKAEEEQNDSDHSKPK